MVRERYSAAARVPEAALCCAVECDPRYLEVIPAEIIEKDYGCGDPSRYVREGDTVLDLGAGAGKNCYIAAQIAGPRGRVIGVDMNDDMLALARRYREEIAARLGYDNLEFRQGRIQDLALDRQALGRWLSTHPVGDERALRELEAFMAAQRRSNPLVADASVDLVISNCVLNLVADEEKAQLFAEIYRVLRSGGRAAISDIVADEQVPPHLKENPALWSGCISGALQEEEFLQAFEAAGFYGIEMVKRDQEPWRTVEGIEFRSVTVLAHKGEEGECRDGGEALIYKGPFKQVSDEEGHSFVRGQRVAVCRKTFERFSHPPYAAHFERVEPLRTVEDPPPFPCGEGVLRRHPRQTKGEDYQLSTGAAECGCGPGSCC